MQLKGNRLTGKVQRSMANAKFRNWITSNAKHTSEMSVRVRLALLLPFMVLIGGCYSSHSGSLKVTVGNATFLPELSTKSGSLHLRLLETINGAVIYAPSNSYTSIAYTNTSKTTYFGIIKSEDSKSLSTTISIPTDRKKTNDDINKPKQQKKPNANEEKVTADAPITKRCDGLFLLKRNLHHVNHNEIISAIIPQHSDPQVFNRHNVSSSKTKTQNITAAYTSRDCRHPYLKTHERSNQIGFRAFPYLLCRDRSYRDNLLMSPS